MLNSMTKDSPEPPNDTGDTPENMNQASGDTYDSEPGLDDGDSQEGDANLPTGGYSEPDENPPKEYDKEKLLDFFGKKGTVEILAQLADGPKRFSEIDDALTVSHGTIANRLRDGIDLDLWREYITYPDDGGKIKLYELEPEAEHLAEIAEEKEIRETTERLREINQRHANAVSGFRNEIKTDDSSE